MSGLFKAALIVIGVLIVLSLVKKIVAFTLGLITLIVPLLIIALVAYLIYRAITRTCVSATHRSFH